jgi:hypothetical protein
VPHALLLAPFLVNGFQFLEKENKAPKILYFSEQICPLLILSLMKTIN